MVNLSNEIIVCIVVSVIHMIWTHISSEQKPPWKTYFKNAIFGFVSSYGVILVTKRLSTSPSNSKPLILSGGNYQENIQVGEPTF